MHFIFYEENKNLSLIYLLLPFGQVCTVETPNLSIDPQRTGKKLRSKESGAKPMGHPAQSSLI